MEEDERETCLCPECQARAIGDLSTCQPLPWRQLIVGDVSDYKRESARTFPSSRRTCERTSRQRRTSG
jgi:hypothetical protein